MASTAVRARGESERARSALCTRLAERREEIEAAALNRVRAIADPAEIADPTYADGLRTAVSAAVAYGIEAMGRGTSEPPVPVPLLAQARVAARVGIPLDTVLRRYFAGYSLLTDFILEEASHGRVIDDIEFRRLLGFHAGVFDRLLAAIAEEHARESGSSPITAAHRLTERIESLLAGDFVDTSEIDYDFEAHHIGLVLIGQGAHALVRWLSTSLDRRSLIAYPRESTIWAWLGGSRSLASGTLAEAIEADCSPDLQVSIGEPNNGLAGWQLTHRQAVAALPVALRRGTSLVRYRDVAVLATALRDDVLATSLRRLYLDPLETGRDGGAKLRATLRAYFAADRNVSSTAARLGVKRHTVTNRLREGEGLIGRSLSACAAEIETALDLAELEGLPLPRHP